MMVPRYLPNAHFADPLRLLVPAHDDARADALVVRLAYGRADLTPRPFRRLREGLLVYFRHVRDAAGPGRVVLSAQTCPAVAQAIVAAGLQPTFVDLDPALPTPSAEQFAAALASDVVCAVVAPLYGHLPSRWDSLLHRIDGVRLLLDLAQGLGLGLHGSPLAQHADAIGYSFGLGKGLDTGGSLLLARERLADEAACISGRWHCLQTCLQGLALRALFAVGGYSLAAQRADAAASEPSAGPIAVRRYTVQPVASLWAASMNAYDQAVRLARERAAMLAHLPGVGEAIGHAEECFSARSTHLRQLLRFRSAEAAARALRHFRERGIDCAPAGEPLPEEYLGPGPHGVFPNSRAFRAETLRLPFTGRLTDAQFGRMVTALEELLEKRVH